MSDFSYYEPDGSGTDYRARKKGKNECRNTILYCVLSMAFLIAAGALNNPVVAASIPGGELTLIILSGVIVVGVVGLCCWQAPRPRKQ